ncbi:MAG: ATP-binding protein [Candidatus Pacearchaeota archaeon]
MGEKEQKKRAKFVIVNLIRTILVLAFIAAVYSGRQLVLIMSVAGIIITFLPEILKRFFKIQVPAEAELIAFVFIYGMLFLGEVRGLFAEFWWWDIILNFIASVALSFIGLTLLYVLYKEDKIDSSPFVICFFAFCFTIALGSLWEIFEFSLDSFLGFNMQKASLYDTMKDIIVNAVGAIIVSSGGDHYIKKGRVIFVSTFIEKLVEKNPKLFKSNKKEVEIPIRELIKKGESHDLEFKSSLRTNLHTKEADKKIEHATLKTISAYLNSNGGNLLIGVSDKGEVIGLEHDNFQDNDKLSLHLTNLIKTHIGNEYLPFIKHSLINVGDKNVLSINCKPSNKHVFLKTQNGEEFYVRNGPASIRLEGNALIDYVNHKFNLK